MDRLRVSLLAAALIAAPSAQADLYRWVDPATGSVKLSNYPPPAGRAAEVVPYRGQETPVAPPSVLAGSSSLPPASLPLEQRWRALLQGLGTLPPDADPRTAGPALRRQLEAYQAVTAGLDRVDPAGAAQRREEQAGVFERLRKGLAAQMSAGSPVRP